MSIEKQIREYLTKNIKESTTKIRDIDLILYYFGFDGDLWPTLDDAAIKFDVGESGGRRSERPRQIINKKFKNKAKLNDFPLLNGFAQFLRAAKIHTKSELQKYCFNFELFEGKINYRGLLKLLHDLGECKDYHAYSMDLKKISKGTYQCDQDIIVANGEHVKKLTKFLKVAKTMPGMIGVSKVDYLKREFELDSFELGMLVSIMKYDSDSWFYNHEDEDYYLFESRDNILLNSLEKIRNISEHEKLDLITEVLANTLTGRSPPKGREYPPFEVIKNYLSSSKFTRITENILTICVEPKDLTKVERDVVSFMLDNETKDFPEISSYLLSQGHKSATVNKAVFHSPLIHVDKTSGLHHYKYALLGQEQLNVPKTLSRYEEYRRLLRNITANGSNGCLEVNTRKEQHLLRDWLFKDKTYEECAICGREYSVESLIAAHKKMRCNCAENERTDPNIVMPLCVFGCDYLFEKGLIYIEDGCIKALRELDIKYSYELDIIKSITGRALDKRWLKGSSNYFRSTDK